jgi:hypothetical protein
MSYAAAIPPMPDWFPDFVRELAAMSATEFEAGMALLRENEARAEAAKQKRERERAIARLIAKAKRLGVDVTIDPNGAATFRTGNASTPGYAAPIEPEANEWNEWDEVVKRDKH